ncbi:adenylyltransferase/cytidyltransferase family protein [Paracidovorax citrulli]
MNTHPHDQALAIGVFDLFHIGHLRYLQYARQRARQLTVAVTSDAISEAVKGKRPIICQEQRMEIIAGLGWVDEVRLQPCSTQDAPAAAEWILAWGIDCVVAGGGWHGSARWDRLIHVLSRHGIAVEFAPHTDGISTTEILRIAGHRAGQAASGPAA